MFDVERCDGPVEAEDEEDAADEVRGYIWIHLDNASQRGMSMAGSNENAGNTGNVCWQRKEEKGSRRKAHNGISLMKSRVLMEVIANITIKTGQRGVCELSYTTVARLGLMCDNQIPTSFILGR